VECEYIKHILLVNCLNPNKNTLYNYNEKETPGCFAVFSKKVTIFELHLAHCLKEMCRRQC